MRLYVIIFFINSLFAQRNIEDNRFSIGAKFGFGLSNTTKPIHSEYGSALGVAINGGIIVFMPVTPKLLLLSSEIAYSARIFKDDDMDNTLYQINYFEFPVLLNIRLFGIEEFYGYRTLNLEIGMGWSKPVKSLVRTDLKFSVYNYWNRIYDPWHAKDGENKKRFNA